jgi:mannosylglycerate hydrolase
VKKRLHVLSNTHWDREHRHGFQETRMMLVDAVDKLLGIIETDPDFKSFTFDGQSVVLEDYLEIKPHMRGTLEKHIRSGKILAGPWYTLPDCTPANPEALVRNLLVGHRTTEAFGPVMKAGYSIFSFGQIAQLPQLYAEFGIDCLIFYKGAPKQLIKESEFVWEAPDGTRALCSRLGPESRLNFFAYFTVPVILGGHMMRNGWRVDYTDQTGLCHYIDAASNRHVATELKPDIRIREEEIRPAIDEVMRSVEESVAKRTFIAFDGIDFSTPMKEIPAAIARANEIMGDDLEVIHSNITDYFREFREEIDLNSLRIFKGEARFGPISSIHSETLSATMPLKQRMFDAEQELLGYAEPFSVFSDTSLSRYPKEMLDFAWRYLLKAQAHDSFHGAGSEKIVPDTLFRIAQIQEIAETLSRKALERMVTRIDTSALDDDDLFFTVFNPSPFERSERIRLVLEFPRQEHVRSFSIQDLTGSGECPFHVIDQYEKNLSSVNAENRPKAVYSHCVLTDVLVQGVPGCGYKTFLVKREKGDPSDIPNPFGTPVYLNDPIARNTRCLDNGRIRVSVNADSSLSVLDHETGREYVDLHTFIDSGDSGNVWVHNPPVHNTVLESTACPHECAIVENSQLAATLELRIHMHLPVAATPDRKRRTQERSEFNLFTQISLKAGSRTVEFKTQVENRVRDHKLSLRFQPGIHADFTTSDSSFELKRRPIDPLHEIKDHQSAIYRHPLQTFVDLSTEAGGLALFTKGLHEFETGNPENPFVGLTLLRSVTQAFPVHLEAFLTAEKEHSQCQGSQRFEYAFMVHPGSFEKDCVAQHAERYVRPVRAMQYGKMSGGTMSLSGSGLSVSHPLTKVLCVKKAEDDGGVIIRLNNPSDEIIHETVLLPDGVKTVWQCNCNEEAIRELNANGCQLKVELAPYKIVTLKCDV